MADPVLNDSCMADFDAASTPYEEALLSILQSVTPVTDKERLPIRDALHRIIAEDVCADQDVPTDRSSAMDGYACRYSDLAGNNAQSTLYRVGTSAAGSPFAGEVKTGGCVRIFTGGVVPDGLDTVVMQEDCRVDDDVVTTINTHQPGQHIRQSGEDIAAGDIALANGRKIGTAELGLLASVGRSEVSVYRKPKVAFFSTGDELRAVGEKLNPGDVYDSNRYTLYGMLLSAEAEPIDLGVVRDDLEQTITALKVGAAKADAVITSAGASVGDADFVKQALESLGELTLWKVAMKPGRPLAFGKIGKTWFFGLPGNPVSVMVTFDKFVRPALSRLKGENPSTPIQLLARIANPIRKRPGRLEFQRGILSFNANGEPVVESTGNQSSGVLTSMSRANCYIVLPLTSGDMAAGTMVTVEPFEALV
ncbi:MAG: molybdopterin molybdotransferase MoeA [Acidiferrobacterales bacterium]|nr:molybdopterin molybdotransferase MoeA [Acidiferrobacterales bacterium]